MMRLAAPLALTFVLALASGARADYAEEILRDRPVAWWRFADKITADGAAAKDETGKHAGTYHGNTTGADGAPESAAARRSSTGGLPTWRLPTTKTLP